MACPEYAQLIWGKSCLLGKAATQTLHAAAEGSWLMTQGTCPSSPLLLLYLKAGVLISHANALLQRRKATR